MSCYGPFQRECTLTSITLLHVKFGAKTSVPVVLDPSNTEGESSSVPGDIYDYFEKMDKEEEEETDDKVGHVTVT